MERASALLAIVLAINFRTAQSEHIDLGGSVNLDVVRIPAGSFEMGSPPGESGRGPDEEQHHVAIAEDFWLGRTPVTRGQFARFVQETGYKTEAETGPSGGFGFDGTALVQRKDFNWRNPGFPQSDDHPVVIVTYNDALAFARWLANKSGRPVSLPTEAQWEYACRAGTTSRYYSGDTESNVESIAWFKNNAGNGTRAVAEKTANPFGLCDMSGNVYQWCSDLYAAYLPGGGEQGPMDKARRVLRGGSWLKDAKHLRSAARARNTPGSRNADNGFRIVVGAKVTVATPSPGLSTPAGGLTATPPPGRSTPVEETSPTPKDDTLPARDREASRFSESSGCVVVFIIVLVVAVALIAITVMAIRRRTTLPQAGQSPLLGRAVPRIMDDGFWFDTSGYSPGQVVTYTYTGRNGLITERFLVDLASREQFIYTGLRPSDLVLGAMMASQMNQQAPPFPPPSAPRPFPSSPRIVEDDRPQRYPPAY